MKTFSTKRWMWHLLVTGLLAAGAVGWSAPAASADGLPAGWTPVDADRLATLRGGYVLPGGMLVSFGFERQAWVNGELVSSLRIEVPDVANITAAQTDELARLRDTQLVQVGAGNVFEPGVGAGLVLQNTLDGADIRVMTTIEAGTTALGMLQAANFADAMGMAGIGAIGTP
ncbi:MULTISPECIES: hypothetical protein [unclassified Luteimonas]|uniref:hypothetical protein n=1 Tax=unclassified Luteimonas TaxID=2629088 RepID=UPI0015FFE5CB|nr:MULTISPECIES: hypothetical protein [unclassified Luteimonas]MBB1472409.1 hypothetical protein [Luteimonas sp. MC1782]MBB6598879.1 hypothetical protein [Luteimonas sp. MC1825]QOC89026.1 hypothetical protein IDM46_04645 [Luteimonas sp. MC1825]